MSLKLRREGNRTKLENCRPQQKKKTHHIVQVQVQGLHDDPPQHILPFWGPNLTKPQQHSFINNHRSIFMASTPKYNTCLLDMDGVLAEVSKSYRAAIMATCHHYGATSVTQETISDWKARGGCNNDWKLSLDLINNSTDGQKGLTLQEVTDTFEKFYQGDSNNPGFCDTETLIPAKETLEELAKRSVGGKLGIVTGRPQKDCEKFLKLHKLDHLVHSSVCMEDGPPKPDPFPVIKVCQLMNIQPSDSVVLVGDTPDDIRSAVAAGCRGVGVATPEAVIEAEANGKTFETTKLCIAMKECGADVILKPGFADLVNMFIPVTKIK